jgi:predicted dehydrogenase
LTNVAVAGAGQWGRNHVRTLEALPGARLRWIVEPDDARREAAGRLAPGARLTADLQEALADPRLEALVVASPGPTHHAVATAAVRAGKHVLVEKPLTSDVDSSRDLVRRARRRGVCLAVGHLLVYHPAVRRLARLVHTASFGAIRYVHCTRTNLGRVRPDEGTLESLAPHDLSVMAHLLGRWPVAVQARGARHVQPEQEDVVFVGVRFAGGVLGQIHLSWLEPLKVRRISVVGARAMAVFDDMDREHVLRVYHARIPPPPPDAAGRVRGAVREARPRVPPHQPLAEELRAFLRTVRRGGEPLTPGEDGVRVAQVLDGARRSLAEGGGEVPLRIR